MASVEKRKAEEDATNQPPNKLVKADGEELKNHEGWSLIEWNKFLDEQNAQKHDNIMIFYEKYLSIYVNDGDRLSEYVDMLISGKSADQVDKKKVEEIFGKNLNQIMNVRLWRIYLKYVEKINPVDPLDTEKSKNNIIKAYRFAISKVGIDFFQGYEIFNDYLKYLKSWETMTSSEVETKNHMIRKVLKNKALLPGIKLEENWDQWCKFEMDLNLSKSKQIIGDAKIEYEKLLEFNNQLKKLTANLEYIKDRENFSLRQVKKWNDWIEFEKSNALKLTDDVMKQRVEYVYNLSVQYCRVYPEMWFKYSCNTEKLDEKVRILKDGIAINPINIILTYEMSKIYEEKKEIDQIKGVWLDLIKRIETSSFVNNKDNLITYCYVRLLKIIRRTENNIGEIRKLFKLARQHKQIGWQVYKEYAEIELNNKEVKIATRVYLLGMENFGNKINYNLKFLDFLIKIKDVINLTKTIEECLVKFNDNEQEIKKIFGKYFEIEDEFGDIESYKKMCHRYRKRFGKSSEFELIRDHFYMDDGDVGYNGITKIDELQDFKTFHSVFIETEKVNDKSEALEGASSDLLAVMGHLRNV